MLTILTPLMRMIEIPMLALQRLTGINRLAWVFLLPNLILLTAATAPSVGSSENDNSSENGFLLDCSATFVMVVTETASNRSSSGPSSRRRRRRCDSVTSARSAAFTVPRFDGGQRGRRAGRHVRRRHASSDSNKAVRHIRLATDVRRGGSGSANTSLHAVASRRRAGRRSQRAVVVVCFSPWR